MNEKTQNVPAIDVLDLLRQLLIHWELILICMILCGGAEFRVFQSAKYEYLLRAFTCSASQGTA